MATIKKLNYFNRSKIRKMVQFLNVTRNNDFMNMLSISPFGALHNLLPLKYKFLDETFIISEGNDEDFGMITVSPRFGNYYKLIISQLFFSEKSYDLAQQLINFVVSHYGANGVNAFFVTVNQVYSDLIRLFISQCGFRQCSSIQIWEVNKISFKKSTTIKYRRLRDSDLKELSEIYNDSLMTHFKPTLERSDKEFSESICHGLTYSSEYRYVIEDASSDRVLGYFLISTDDNENFLVDFNYSDGYEIDLDGIMYFATREILKRVRRFKLYVKIKNYLKTGEAQQKYAEENHFSCIQTKLMLVKDFYRVIKQESPLQELKEFIMIGDLNHDKRLEV